MKGRMQSRQERMKAVLNPSPRVSSMSTSSPVCLRGQGESLRKKGRGGNVRLLPCNPERLVSRPSHLETRVYQQTALTTSCPCLSDKQLTGINIK